MAGAYRMAEQAERCTRLAAAICDSRSAKILGAMAAGYDRNARAARLKISDDR